MKIHTNNMTLAKWKFNYERVKKEFWQLIAILIIGIITIYVLIPNQNKNIDEKVAIVSDFFTDALNEYTEQTGKKIYPSGREFLRKAAEKEGLQTKEQVIKLIRDNEKFMWK